MSLILNISLLSSVDSLLFIFDLVSSTRCQQQRFVMFFIFSSMGRKKFSKRNRNKGTRVLAPSRGTEGRPEKGAGEIRRGSRHRNRNTLTLTRTQRTAKKTDFYALFSFLCIFYVSRVYFLGKGAFWGRGLWGKCGDRAKFKKKCPRRLTNAAFVCLLQLQFPHWLALLFDFQNRRLLSFFSKTALERVRVCLCLSRGSSGSLRFPKIRSQPFRVRAHS